MTKNPLVAPVVKWVGGKRQLLDKIDRYIPEDFDTYYEPFLGGGAVLFHIQPKNAIVNDVNEELINLYRVIKEDVDELIEDLEKHKNEEEYFYKIRAIDRDKSAYEALTPVKKASRLLYLNKTCFNGLFRVNRRGEFNTPFGRYKNPNIVNATTLRAVSQYFNEANIVLKCGDFEDSVKEIQPGSFVYFDPPYDPISDSANFTEYDKGGFGRDEQERLKKLCDKLNDKGVKFLLSNSATDFILDLYKGYTVREVQARRSINSRGDRRGGVKEVLVMNYDCNKE